MKKTLLVHKWVHYLDVYEQHFKKFQKKNPTILEIGVYEGGSLEMWNYFFDNECNIYGIDINPKCIEKINSLKRNNIKVILGDQGSVDFWKNFLKDKPKFDIIIDDGGHQMQQQIVSYEQLYDHMTDDGVYLCEDLHTSYWKRNNSSLHNPNSFIEYSKKFVDMINFYHIEKNAKGESENVLSDEDREKYKKFRDTTKSVHYYDSILILERQKLPQKPKHVKMH